jgi:hypothetical protein
VSVGDDGKLLVVCSTGCTQDEVVAELQRRGLWHSNGKSTKSAGLTLIEYARAKNLDIAGLREHGVANAEWYGQPAVLMPYHDASGRVTARRFRVALEKNGRDERFRWEKGAQVSLYGLERVQAMSEQGAGFLVEGESDAHTLWMNGFPAVAVPGASNWKDERDATALAGVDTLYVVNERDKGADSLLAKLSSSSLKDRIGVIDLAPYKDPSELWLADPTNFHERMIDAIGRAVGVTDVVANLTSNHKNTSLEVGLVSTQSRSFDAADLLAAEGDDELIYLPLLGRDGYFVAGWSHLLAGYPRVGKSELVVSCVEQWLSRGQSVLLFTEEPTTLWRQRLRQRGTWQRGLRLYPALGADPAELLAELPNAAEPVVVLDSIRNLLRFEDENDNSEVARKINPWVAAARTSGKTLILVHHCRKGGGDNAEAIAGGHALLGAVDIALEVVRDQNQAATRRKIRAYARLIQPGELLYEMSDDKQLRALGDPAAVTLGEVERRVQEVLGADWLKTKDVHEALAEPQPSVEQVRRALTGLARQGVVERDPPMTVERTSGKTIRWRLANLTSNGPSYTLEVEVEGRPS